MNLNNIQFVRIRSFAQYFRMYFVSDFPVVSHSCTRTQLPLNLYVSLQYTAICVQIRPYYIHASIRSWTFIPQHMLPSSICGAASCGVISKHAACPLIPETIIHFRCCCRLNIREDEPAISMPPNCTYVYYNHIRHMEALDPYQEKLARSLISNWNFL